MLYYNALFATTIVVSIVIAISAGMTKSVHGKSVRNLMFASASVTLCYLLAINVGQEFPASLFSSLHFISVDWVLLCLLNFSRRFTARPGTKLRNYYIEYVLAGVDAIILLINPFIPIALTYRREEILGYTIFQYHAGFLYACHLAFCYSLVVISLGILLLKAVRSAPLYRGKYLTMSISIVVVVVLNLIYLVNVEYLPIDISVLFYSVCGLLILYCVFFYSRRIMKGQVRDYLMDNLNWALALFDDDDRMVDMNKRFHELFPQLNDDMMEEVPLKGFLEENEFPALYEDKQVFEWSRSVQGEVRNFSGEYSYIRDRDGDIIGKMITLHDITYARDTVTGLDYTPALRRFFDRMGDLEHSYPVQLLVVNINGLSVINETVGHSYGNELMVMLRDLVLEVCDPTYLCKSEDGSLVAALLNTSNRLAIQYAEEVKRRIYATQPFHFKVEAEYGVAELNHSSTLEKAITEAEDSMRNKKLLSDSSSRSSLINSMQQTLMESDYETEEHVVRTKAVAVEIGRLLGLSDREIGNLALLSIMHDIGKICIPKEILTKPGRLNDEEWEIMKSHTVKGYRIAKASPELAPIADTILHHHERWDGNGYPDKLKGENIPLLSRIVSVVDSFDVMTHDRPYHKAISTQAAREELIRCSGSQFDPKIVEVYLRMLDEK